MLALTACQKPRPQLGPDGKAAAGRLQDHRPRKAEIPGRVLGQINALRAKCRRRADGGKPDAGRSRQGHARDMAAQNRAWHFGSDGSSPLDRVRRQGYTGKLIGENISETYENEITAERLDAGPRHPRHHHGSARQRNGYRLVSRTVRQDLVGAADRRRRQHAQQPDDRGPVKQDFGRGSCRAQLLPMMRRRGPARISAWAFRGSLRARRVTRVTAPAIVAKIGRNAKKPGFRGFDHSDTFSGISAARCRDR